MSLSANHGRAEWWKLKAPEAAEDYMRFWLINYHLNPRRLLLLRNIRLFLCMYASVSVCVPVCSCACMRLCLYVRTRLSVRAHKWLMLSRACGGPAPAAYEWVPHANPLILAANLRASGTK